MGEVNHRAKNMLGLVQAIARQTAARGTEDFIERFGQRIQALAASQDLLVKGDWRAVPLEDLVRSQLDHFGEQHDRRISMSGPSVKITNSASQTLGMALHELATNAAKHGALSNDVGRVEIGWDVRSGAAGGSPRFTMGWTESGGPPVAKPARRGFGSTVINGMVKMSLNSDPHIDFAPTGLLWRIDCPADRVIEGRGTQSQTLTKGAIARATATERKRVLVVEDEALIAMEIAATLSDAGFEVLGPASSVAQALALIESTGCHAAVLDTNLGAETSEPVALRLRSTKTQFVTVSGYSREQLPVGLRDAPLLNKPLRSEQLVAAIRRCLED
jgi:two-component sensor histidine kinase/CheY-like chemotaxis protein